MRKHFQLVNYASVDYPYLHACHVGRLLRRRYARHLSRPDVFRGTATLREPWLIRAVMDPSASAVCTKLLTADVGRERKPASGR
jgi:hypothetical protein